MPRRWCRFHPVFGHIGRIERLRTTAAVARHTHLDAARRSAVRRKQPRAHLDARVASCGVRLELPYYRRVCSNRRRRGRILTISAAFGDCELLPWCHLGRFWAIGSITACSPSRRRGFRRIYADHLVQLACFSVVQNTAVSSATTRIMLLRAFATLFRRTPSVSALILGDL